MSARRYTSCSWASADVGMGIVSWLADGAIVRQDNYYRWSNCVEALGLDEVTAAVSG